jgi:hypothetical protein
MALKMDPTPDERATLRMLSQLRMPPAHDLRKILLDSLRVDPALKFVWGISHYLTLVMHETERWVNTPFEISRKAVDAFALLRGDNELNNIFQCYLVDRYTIDIKAFLKREMINDSRTIVNLLIQLSIAK